MDYKTLDSYAVQSSIRILDMSVPGIRSDQKEEDGCTVDVASSCLLPAVW